MEWEGHHESEASTRVAGNVEIVLLHLRRRRNACHVFRVHGSAPALSA